MQDIYKTFEFDKIRQTICDLSKSELGKEYSLSLSFSSNHEKIKNDLKDLDETISLLTRFGEFPVSNSANAIKLINIAKKTALLSPRDLSLIAEDVVVSNRIKSFLNKIISLYPRIKEKADKFNDLDNLEKEIHRVITSSLTIDDKATPELKDIRSKLKKLESTLISKSASLSLSYSQYLSDNNSTIREGHYVIPVKTAYKNKVKGIIYDVSDSGNTTFIEPLEIVELNNQITELKVLENDEIRKILKNLTSLVLLQEHEIITNNQIIGELDFLLAKAKYAQNINAIVSEISEKKQLIDLANARHPLIDMNKVVGNSYKLNEETRLIIISGPNAGGKTVSLKTVGLMVLMNQCGLAIPCDKSELAIFDHVYVDIGDNQSLSDNLSTFSAHISQISEILNVVKGKDLVLFDELGTGTDPKDGEAIALSTVKYLESKHCLGMISSHFGKLKEYALTNENMENSSMIFDEINLLPTYIFKQGVPGKSYGIEVASRFNLPSQVIDDAKLYIKQNINNQTEELLNTLQNKVIANEKLNRELTNKEHDINQEIKRLENENQLLKQRKERLLETVKKEKEEIIDKTTKQIDDIVKKMSSGDLKLHEVLKLKEEVENLKDDIVEVSYNQDIQINDYVSYPPLNIEGRVARINGKKASINTTEGLNIEVDKDKLIKSEPPRQSKVINKQNYEDKILTNIGLELNIIGLRRDEAYDKVVKYIDNCRMKHLKSVRIIHGFGSGILRKMVHDYLKTQKDLSFRLGDIYEGGSGATQITFND